MPSTQEKNIKEGWNILASKWQQFGNNGAFKGWLYHSINTTYYEPSKLYDSSVGGVISMSGK